MRDGGSRPAVGDAVVGERVTTAFAFAFEFDTRILLPLAARTHVALPVVLGLNS